MSLINSYAVSSIIVFDIRVRVADPLVARFSADTPDVAQRRAAACPQLYGRLRRSAWLRAQWLPGLHPGPYALCEARHGARHGDRHGAAWVSALLGRWA